MPSTLSDFKSKRACPNCKENKLFTNDDEKNSYIVHYKCLNCNEFLFETNKNKKLNKEQAQKQEDSVAEEKPSNVVGIALIFMILAAILFLNSNSGGEDTEQQTVQPAAQATSASLIT